MVLRTIIRGDFRGNTGMKYCKHSQCRPGGKNDPNPVLSTMIRKNANTTLCVCSYVNACVCGGVMVAVYENREDKQRHWASHNCLGHQCVWVFNFLIRTPECQGDNLSKHEVKVETHENSAFRRKKKKIIFMYRENNLSLEQRSIILLLVLTCAYMCMQDLIFTGTLSCHLVPLKLHAHLISYLFFSCFFTWKVFLFPSLSEPYPHNLAQVPRFQKDFP